jgi:hypothetical protein
MPPSDWSVCHGTVIVAVRTPEVFAIAADGEGTFRSEGKVTSRRSVPKIFQQSGALYAISGLTKDPGRGFDPTAMIAASLAVPLPLRNTANSLEVLLSKALEDELTKLRVEEPALFREAVEGDNRGTSVLLARWENGEPAGIGLHFLPAVDVQGNLTIQTQRLACPGDCPRGTFTWFLGHRKAINKYVAERGNNMRMSPEDGVRFLVQLEIDAGTPGVGPPIHVVRLDGDGVTWLSGTSGNE